MSDLEVIKEIEQILNIKLDKYKKVTLTQTGYTLNYSGQVTTLTFCGCIKDNLNLISSQLKEFKHLTSLYFVFCQIKDITPLLGLIDISTLFLYSDFVTPIDISPLQNLKNLTSLSLVKVRLNEISVLEHLVNLTNLELINNKLNDISPLRDLKNLTHLIIRYNNLQDITPLKDLKQLIRLDLSGNHIEELPKWITELNMEIYFKENYSGTGINLYKNSLQNPPIEIVKQGKKAIKNYFDQINIQGKDRIYEAKLMLVGEPGSGKTTLMNKLFNRNFPVPDESQKSTLGIEVRQNWQYGIQQETDCKAHIWDFGGQQIQYMLHQFFLTPDCVYILMAEKRKELANFDYWLNIIHILGKNSPVLILFNEININSATSFIYDEKKYKTLFPDFNLQKIDINLSNIEDGRFDLLVNTIKEKLGSLSHIGKEVPARWVDIRKGLEEIRNKKHISINDYFDICNTYSIDKEEDRLLILRYFHLLGIVLHFSEDPNLRDTLFLDPNWTVDAVYAVLNDETIKNNDGTFSQEEIDKIWAEKGYNYDERAALLRLMLKDNFDLCYKLPGNENKYIVPLLLSKLKPEYDWDSHENLQFRFQYPFMPKGIVSRLIVRMHEYIDGRNVWNEGVVFDNKGVKTQVIEAATTKEGLKIIDIRIQGAPNFRKEFLTLIRDEIKKIQQSSFPNLPYFEMVPCKCKECVASKEPEFYDNKSLDNLLSKGKLQVQCHKSGELVDITSLIDAVLDIDIVFKKEVATDLLDRFTPLKHNKCLPEVVKRDIVFVSYSRKDKDWLERVQTHLKVLGNLGITVNLWDDTKIKAGMKWREEIEKGLASAKVAILLVSTDFLASDFISKNELPPLLKAAAEDGATIIPVILKPCLFEKFKALSEFQAVNNPTKALSKLTDSEQDDILVDLANRIAELMNS